MKPKSFQRSRDDSDSEEFILESLKNGDFGSPEFGRTFSEFTSSVINEIKELPSCFDGCSAHKLKEDDRKYRITGGLSWLGDCVADQFQFDLDRTGTNLYSWKFFRGKYHPEQVLYVAKMRDGWKYSATFT